MATTNRARASVLPGFGALLEKELLEAQRSKRVIVFLLVMTGCLVLVATIGYLRIEHLTSSTRHEIGGSGMDAMLGSWTALVGFLGSLMVVASTVDAVSRERSLGISAWIVTKPVSRMSYLAAKAVAHSLVAIGTLVVAPTLVWLVMMLALFQGVPIGRILAAELILCVEMGFLSFFIIALGVPFRSVPPIAMLGLGLWFLPNFVTGLARLSWTYRVLPSYLDRKSVV